MGVSRRCDGFNLLNHIRQKSIYEVISVEYNQLFELDELLKDKYFNEGYSKCDWLVTLKLGNNTYTSIGSVKKSSLLNNIKQAEDTIFKDININLLR